MRKKILAVILAIVLAFSASPTVFAVSLPSANEIASAVSGDLNAFKTSVVKLSSLSKQLLTEMGPYLSDVVLTTDNVKTAVDLSSKLMIKLAEKIGGGLNPDKPDKPDNPDKPDKPDKPGTAEIALTELKKIISKYIYVKVDDIDEATREVLEGNGIIDKNGEGNGVKYYNMTLSDGSQTVYIAVDIEAHPEIFNYEVFKNTVEAIYKKQGEALIKNDDGSTNYLMSYEHIAGELAMHAIIFAAASELINITDTKNETILKLYKSAAKADLNIDEARIPSALISIFGVLLVDMFTFNVLKLFMR